METTHSLTGTDSCPTLTLMLYDQIYHNTVCISQDGFARHENHIDEDGRGRILRHFRLLIICFYIKIPSNTKTKGKIQSYFTYRLLCYYFTCVAHFRSNCGPWSKRNLTPLPYMDQKSTDTLLHNHPIHFSLLNVSFDARPHGKKKFKPWNVMALTCLRFGLAALNIHPCLLTPCVCVRVCMHVLCA